MQDPVTLCAFDVDAAGRAVAVEGPLAAAAPEGCYRWLHFDVAAAGLEPWLRAHLPEAAVDALLQAETRPRCDAHGAGAIINLRGVNLNPGASPEDMVSLRIWMAEGLVVTARLRKIWALDAIRAQAEAEGQAPESSGALLAAIAEGLTRRIEAVALELEEQTDALEETVLGEAQEVPLAQLSGVRHTVIKLRRFVNPQREALEALAAGEAPGMDARALSDLRESANRSARNVEALDATRERLMALQDHMEVQRGQRLGQNSYVLSVVAAIFLPLGFLTGLFGVNVAGMPGVDHAGAFWILSAGSLALGVLLYLVFKLGRWL